MNPGVLFVTGTDTGVGKTVLACLLTRHLRDAGVAVAALKPVSSGNRNDARLLHTASDGALPLAKINPWHFRASLSPLLAARREGRKLTLKEVVTHVHRVGQRFQTVVLEGAGGLLSPLGVDFDSRDLIIALRAAPLVLCWNRLGAINQCLLVLAALPRRSTRQAQVILMSPRSPDPAGRGNSLLLAQRLGEDRAHVLPWMGRPDKPGDVLTNRRVRRVLIKLAAAGGRAKQHR